MATCRIQTIKPPCAYNVEGVERIFLLDVEDFGGLRFDGDDLYSNCLVTDILRDGVFIELDTPETARYLSTLAGGIYTHTLETFIGDLQAELLADLHLATKRRYFVVFKAKTGRYFGFGYDAGAGVTYANQTAEATGSLVTAVAQSVYPLFEVEGTAITDMTPYDYEFIPDFLTNTYCVNG